MLLLFRCAGEFWLSLVSTFGLLRPRGDVIYKKKKKKKKNLVEPRHGKTPLCDYINSKDLDRPVKPRIVIKVFSIHQYSYNDSICSQRRCHSNEFAVVQNT